MKIFSRPDTNAIAIGIVAGFLAIAGYLLMWALWYAIAPHPYYGYVVAARAQQEGLFMYLVVPVVTALGSLAANARRIRTGGEALSSAVFSGLASWATFFIAAVAGVFGLFFRVVPGPFQCESVMFCGSTNFDWFIQDPLPIYYFGPHGHMLGPMQGALSVLFDVVVQASWFLIVPTIITVVMALAIFYLVPQLYRIFADDAAHNREKAMLLAAVGLVIAAVIIIPPIVFVYL